MNRWMKDQFIPTGEALQNFLGIWAGPWKKRRFFQSVWEKGQDLLVRKTRMDKGPQGWKLYRRFREQWVVGYAGHTQDVCRLVVGNETEKWRPRIEGHESTKSHFHLQRTEQGGSLTCIISPTQNNLKQWFSKCILSSGASAWPGNPQKCSLSSSPTYRTRSSGGGGAGSGRFQYSLASPPGASKATWVTLSSK